MASRTDPMIRTAGYSTTTTPAINPSDRNAQARITELLTQFGLGSLAGKVLGYIQEGMSDDSIMLELQNTNEWKTRFSANEVRRKKGLPVLTPAEYLATERSYGQIMAEAGVPKGFYDQPSDFADFLANDMSPAELKGRVDTAAEFVRSASPQQRAAFKQWYTEGDMIAFALDQKKAAPLVGKAFQAASTAGIAAQDGLQIGKQTAEQLAAAGITDAQARAGFGSIAQDKSALDTLAGIDQQQALTADQLAQGAFLGNASVVQQQEKLKSRERARLSGRSGLGQDSLSSGSTGL